MSSTEKQGSSLGSFPTSPPLYPHFNWPSGFWPCVKSCLVGGSDKYLVTIAEGTRRLPFHELQDRGLGEGAILSLGLLQFTLDPYLIILSVNQGGIKNHNWVIDITRPGIEPLFSRAIVELSTLLAKFQVQLALVKTHDEGV